MRPACGLLYGVFLTATLSQAQPYPVINGVVCAAGNWSAAEFGLARGSLFTIYGTNLAPSVVSASGLPLTTVLNGATVTVTSSIPNYLSIDAPLLYVSPTQINAILPSALPEGSGSLVVKSSGVSSNPSPVLVMRSRFAAFTRSQLGFGPALLQQFDRTGVSLNGLTRPAAPGQAVVLWGTGLGPLPSGRDAEAPGAANLASDVVISVGGTLVKPFYAGRSPQLPGLDQINFYLPATVQAGCYVPVTVSVSGKAQFGVLIRGEGRIDSSPTLSIGTPNSTCGSELGLSPALVQRLDQGGTVRVAALSFDSGTGSQVPGVSNGQVSQTAKAWLSDYDAANLGLLATGWRWPPSAPGSCERQAYSGPITPVYSTALGMILQQLYGAPSSGNATLSLKIAGPGCSWGPISSTGFIYAGSFGDTCPVSSYSLSGYAGNVALFSVAGPLPAPRQWSPSNRLGLASQSDGSGIRATWNITDLKPSDQLTLSLDSGKYTGSIAILPTGYDDNSLTCNASLAGNSFLVQPDDVQWLSLISAPGAAIQAAQLSVVTMLGSSAGIPSPAPPGAPDVFLLSISNRLSTFVK